MDNNFEANINNVGEIESHEFNKSFANNKEEIYKNEEYQKEIEMLEDIPLEHKKEYIKQNRQENARKGKNNKKYKKKRKEMKFKETRNEFSFMNRNNTHDLDKSGGKTNSHLQSVFLIKNKAEREKLKKENAKIKIMDVVEIQGKINRKSAISQ